MLLVVKTGNQLEVTSPMPAGKRLLFFILGLVPLLAPYELLLKPGWENILNPYLCFAAIVSLGAVLVSGFLVWAAIAGLESSARFDLRLRTLTTASQAPVAPLTMHTYSLDDLLAVKVEATEWSDSSPSYSLRIEIADGRALELPGGFERQRVEEVLRRVGCFLAAPPAA